MNTQEIGVTVDELGFYYLLRRETKRFGYTDKEYQRQTKPIARSERKETINRARFNSGVLEELFLLCGETGMLESQVKTLVSDLATATMERAYHKFEVAYLRRDLKKSRMVARERLEEINFYRLQLGLLEDDGTGKDKLEG